MSFSGFKMHFPIIKVRDKTTGSIHIVGADSHDTLRVGRDGHIKYYNLQNGEGTGGGYRYSGYEFVGEEDELSSLPDVHFASLDELLEIMKEEAELSAEQERLLRRMFADIWSKHDKEQEASAERGFVHS